MLRIEGLAKRYITREHEVTALSGIGLDIADGEFVSLLGPSGCGKSTLLRIIAGLLPASAGRVSLDGRELRGPGPERAMVFQDYALFPWMTVLDNVAFGLEARGIARAPRLATARGLLQAVGLADFAERYPHQLSGGMKQRVSIARAFAVDPAILLMDEPFGALDAQTRQGLQDQLLRIWGRSGKTVVFVTHAIEEAITLSDRIVVMTARPGRIKAVISLPEPRPRDMASPEMGARLREVRAVLNDEITRAAALEQADMLAAE